MTKQECENNIRVLVDIAVDNTRKLHQQTFDEEYFREKFRDNYAIVNYAGKEDTFEVKLMKWST